MQSCHGHRPQTTLLALTALLAAALPPREARAEPTTAPSSDLYVAGATGESVPWNYPVEPQPRLALVVPGAILFGASYSLTVVGAASNLKRQDGLWPAFIPIAGPFIAAATARPKDGSVDTPSLQRASLIVLGGIQTAGAALTTLGLALPKRTLLPPRGGRYWHVAPLSMPDGGVGAGVVGRL